MPFEIKIKTISNMKYIISKLSLCSNIPLVMLFLFIINACGETHVEQQKSKERKTKVTIVGDQFYINGAPTYQGRIWTTSKGESFPVEGLLMNSRMVQGIFDDLNPQTVGQWAYPDTKKWDADRNTREFIEAMPAWLEHGMLSFTINLQGGCPYGYCRTQPWDNSAFNPDGSLRQSFMDRLELILDRADELGMVPIVGYFYFGQDENLVDEEAIKKAVVNATQWILDKGYTNVIIEINNECNVKAYDHAILVCDRVHELIKIAKEIEKDGQSLYISTSLGGGAVPPANIVEVSDYVLLHGNGVRDPARMVEMIKQVREMEVYNNVPIVNNEDDQPWRVAEQGWGEYENTMVAAVQNYASWGYFDFRLENENALFNEGFQSVPINWQISSERKQAFFDLLATITGYPGTPKLQMEWSDEPGKVTVKVENARNFPLIEEVNLLINNQIVQKVTSAPYSFEITEMPEHWHQVKASAKYQSGNKEIIIETPIYENPWWLYGGAKRN
jgi:hypothetical protein